MKIVRYFGIYPGQEAKDIWLNTVAPVKYEGWKIYKVVIEIPEPEVDVTAEVQAVEELP